MQKNTTLPTGFSSCNPRMSILIANSWLSNLRFHATTRDQSAVFEVSSPTRTELEAAHKIAYEISSQIHQTLTEILCFADCYTNHDGNGRPNTNYIMRDDQTIFLHGFLLLGLDTVIAPKFAIKLNDQPTQLVSPLELLIGVNLSALRCMLDIASVNGYKTLSIEAQELVLEFATKQIKHLNSYIKASNQSLGINTTVIKKISQHYLNDLGFKVTISGCVN